MPPKKNTALPLVLLAITVAAASLVYADQMPEGRLMRFPDIQKDRVVFSYGGDLWLVSSQGGTASRITTHPGLELFPKFSPDGKWIAFMGQYDGNFNVYVMPSGGGQPKQLTFLPDIGQVPPSHRRGCEGRVREMDPGQRPGASDRRPNAKVLADEVAVHVAF